MRLTAEEIEAARSRRGGWTAATLAGWGVPWPPPKGWRERLIYGDGAPGPRGRAFPPKPLLMGKTGGPVVDHNEEWPPWESGPEEAMSQLRVIEGGGEGTGRLF